MRLALPFKRFGMRSLGAAKDSEVGQSGTVVWGGQIREEYLTSLQGKTGMDIYDQMRRSDAQVAMLLRAIKLPILKCKWSVQPSEYDPDKGEAIAEMVRRNLIGGGLNRTWTQFLSEAMLMMPFGFVPFEKVWEYRERTPELAKLGAPEKMVWLKKMALRHPKTVYSWRGLDAGSLEGIEQSVSTGANPFIPIEKLCVFINDREGDNWEGVSILRPAYKHWLIKEQLEKIDAAGHERMSIGIPVASIDNTVNDTDATANAWEEILSNLQAMERNYIVEMPGTKFRFEVVASGNTGLLASMNYHARMISVAGLIQFMELGNTQSGSRAVATEQSGPFLLELEAILNNLCETVNQFVVAEFVDMNFGERPGYPEIKASGLTEESTSELATFLKTLVDAKVIVPDDELEKYVREMGKLPASDPDTGREVKPAGPGFIVGEGSPLEPAEQTWWPGQVEAVAWQVKSHREDDTGPRHELWQDPNQPTLFAQSFADELRARGLRSILELGTDSGKDSRFFSRAGFAVTSVGSHAESEAARAQATKERVLVDYREGNVEMLTLPDEQYDAVYSLGTLQKTDVGRSFAEAGRVLRSGGLFLVYVHGETQYASKTEFAVHVTPNAFVGALKDAGFSILDFHTEQEEQYDAKGERHKGLVALGVKR